MAAHDKFEIRHYPKLSTIEIHAGKLAERLSIQLSHAYEMLAFYYNCRNWTELKHCVSKSIAYRENTKECGNCHLDSSHIRKLMAHDIRIGRLDVSPLEKVALQPDSIASHLYNHNIEDLFDDEITHAYNVIYAGYQTPSHRPLDVIDSINNSISTLFKLHTSPVNMGRWMHDYRYGAKLFCNRIESNGRKVLIIREFDCHFYPPAINPSFSGYQSSFDYMRRTDWYPKYILSYLGWIIFDLATNSDIDTIIIHRLLNIDIMNIINTECSKKLSYTVSEKPGVNFIANKLVSIGATPQHLFGAADTRVGLALDIRAVRFIDLQIERRMIAQHC